jgi:hypothetical protein
MKFCPKLPLILLSIALFSFTKCKKPEEYPIIPAIEFKSFATIPDTAGTNVIMTISFTDGDGDIGLADNEIQPPFDNNLFVTYFEKQNGKWTDTIKTVQFKDTVIYYNGRIPFINTNGKNKNIKGEIQYKMLVIKRPNASGTDTIAFKIYILDRALHKSNIIMTPQLIINNF